MVKLKRFLFVCREAFTIVCVIFSASCACAQETATSILQEQMEYQSRAQLIEKYANQYPNNTQLSFAILEGDKTTFVGVEINSDTLRTIINKESVFEIGSISKVFNAVLFSHHIHEKKVAVDDPLIPLLPFEVKQSPEGGDQVTLKMLANHSSGLPRLPLNIMPQLMWNQTNPYKDYTKKFIIEYFTDQMVLENKPGTTYSYSNLGAGTLGYLMTEISKMSYEELLNHYIFDPLDMTKSSIYLSDYDESEVVNGCTPKGTKADNWEFTDAMAGMGAIKSTVVDMEKFVRKNMEGNAVYELTHQPTFVIDDKMKVGLGWHLKTADDRTIIWHNGGTGGYTSCLTIDKENKKAILALSNVSAFHPKASNIDMLCFSMLQGLN